MPILCSSLLQAGSNPNAKDESGWTALTFAARKGYFDIARLLIEKDADVNVRLSDGNTPLSWANAKKDQNMIDLLKSAGALE
ncbi:MAG: ankyrin repeat domain-containing protein [Thiobacillus sp.]|nr:ankyrin repeat domain-containing protein [Thiobacillus sp.]